MYADDITESMQEAIDETERRRTKQIAYNKEHGIDPQPLRKKIADILDEVYERAEDDTYGDGAKRGSSGEEAMIEGRDTSSMASDEIEKLIADLTTQMTAAARELKFELAGRLRDEIADLRKELRGVKEAGI